MKNKVFVIVLIMCCAGSLVFADKGDIRIGAQIGYGVQRINVEKDSRNSLGLHHKGLGLSVTGEYCLSDVFSVKAEIGIQGKGEPEYYTQIDGWNSPAQTIGVKTTANYAFFLGAKYDLNLAESFSIGLVAGIEVMNGVESANSKAVRNTALGPSAELLFSFKAQKSLSIVLGAKAGYLLFNTDNNIANYYMEADDTWKTKSNIILKGFAGVSVAL